MAVFYWRGLLPGTRTKILSMTTVALALWLPWLLYVYSQGPVLAMPSLPEVPSSLDVFNVFAQFSLGFQSNSVLAMLIATWPVLILGGFFAVQRHLHISPNLVYIAVVSMGPVALAYMVSLFTTPFFASHYMVAAFAPLTILVVWLISHYRRMYAVLACCVAIVGSVTALYNQAYSPANPAKQDYKAAALEIGRKVTPKDIVVLAAPDAMYPLGYYYRGGARLTTLPQLDSVVPTNSSTINKAPLPLQVDNINRSHEHTYLLVSNYEGHQKKIVEYYDTHSKKISEHQFASSLQLFVYKN